MEFDILVKERHSCKKFGPKKVGEKELSAILEAGRVAPTAKNLQEQRVYVITSDEGLEKVDTVTPCRYGATACLIVAYDKDNVFTYPGKKMNSGVEDATIVATHMILAAANEGVDSCWVNFFDPEDVKRTFSLPENEEVLMIMDLGYAAEDAPKSPNHDKRKALSETVTEL